MKFEAMEYDMPWRENFEMRSAIGWILSAGVAGAVTMTTSLPPEPFYWMSGISALMIAARMPQALRLFNLHRHLGGRDLSFMTLKELDKQTKKNKDLLWLGKGFDWETRHAQRIFDIIKRDWSAVINNKKRNVDPDAMGQPWIHGVEPKEGDVLQPYKHTGLHTLITGATGSGKTRLYDLIISQNALYERDRPIIILDPKSDFEMEENAREVCEYIGMPERLVVFDPANPDKSIRLDPLSNFGNATELASRIAVLIPSESGSDPFTAFGWQALNNITQAMLIIDERPTLKSMKGYLEGGVDSLVVKTLMTYIKNSVTDGEHLLLEHSSALDNKKYFAQAKTLSRIYYETVQDTHPSSEIEGLLSMYIHDSSHFGKMVASLLPIMNMLTAGDIGDLLSPDYEADDPRPIYDMDKIITQGKILIIKLNSLGDNMVSSAIGSLYLSDLTGVAAARYNYGNDGGKVLVLIDEAAEILNTSSIQLLNKGRGAGLRLYIATQSIADFVVRLGSEDMMMQLLANVNNVIALRVNDEKTQQYIAGNMPKIRLKSVSRSQGANANADNPIDFSSGNREDLSEEEGDMIPPELLGMLPNLEYIAKLSGGRIVKGRLPILIRDKVEG